jgi:hypothetical protein
MVLNSAPQKQAPAEFLMGGHGRGTVERRLTAILAANVRGYSRPIAADEEVMLAALKTLRREVADP